MENKIIVVAGPTASGKTELGLRIAQAVNGEILSADSMQVYKGMPIATAAPTAQEQARVPHHLVEFLEPSVRFSVADWCTLARQKAQGLLEQGKVPVLVGGTGLFIDSFVDNIQFEDVAPDEALRQRLLQRDCQSLYEELLRLDAAAAEQIHPNNKKRVVRALELYYAGVPKTEQNRLSRRKKSPYDSLYFVLTYANRQTLYDRIDRRVEQMVQNGLIEEAKRCLTQTAPTAAQAIGHKELQPYFDGKCTLAEALAHLKQETRHYAKRQITWFKRRTDAVCLPMDEGADKAAETALARCREFLYGTGTGEKRE